MKAHPMAVLIAAILVLGLHRRLRSLSDSGAAGS